ncbi:MAG TPA: hypothetical protein ENJ38_12180 [Rhodospirillales bacterium]|nr:hypothetical protein [Rhodospirillales bacterium]
MSGEGDWLEPEEQRCRLLLAVSADALGPEQDAVLGALLARPEVAGLLLEAGEAGQAVLARWHDRCRTAAAALLLVDAVEPVAAGLADGVHLRDWKRVPEVRGRLGEAALLGADCDLSRHAAMVAGENGADYVMFGAQETASEADAERTVELCAWWSELFVLPCAAVIPPVPALAHRLARVGAGFLVVAPALREAPAEAPEIVATLAAAIAAADGQGNGTS